jgi:putative OPT family oligopeptide transporter
MADPTGITESRPDAHVTAAPPHTAPAAPSSNGEAPEHKPFVPDEDKRPELTWLPLVVGALLGIVFGASSLYLVLKVGLTVSASIPVAVLSITLFRVFSKILPIRAATILENNIVQTTGSAGESIAFGVGVTMPALMLLGFEMDVGRVLVVSVLGGLLGILMMIPLRRAFIVKQHGKLKYPEGTACADVLVAGEKGGATAQTVFIGFGVAFVYEFFRLGFKWFKEVPEKALGNWWKGAVPSIEVNPTLLGVGYIIGTRISCVMVAGGVLASFVLIPAIRLFGDGLSEPLYPATKPIKDMDVDEIWHDYILYIGAGAVAAGGIISMFRALPLIVSSIRAGLSDISAGRGAGGGKRTDRDLPYWVVGVGGLAIVGAIWATTPLHNTPGFSWVPDLHMHFLGAVLIVLFGFLFVTVSSRLTGEIGSSSNPISGMTVATLLLTCLIFLLLGWTDLQDRLTALSVAGVVCIAASNGGTTSQDLKTGYLVGATPKYQQYAILVGSLTSALVIGVILIQLNNAYTVVSGRNLPTPKVPIDMAKLKEKPERQKGPDDAEYYIWRAAEGNDQKVPPGKYLVDEGGKIRYLIDPGINGKLTQRDDGTEVQRFKAPKAALMSFITDGILQRKLPWPLVLLGVAIAVVLELCSVSSLAFAVGVYLPLSSSTPIFVGGLARYVADKWGRRDTAGKTPEQLEAEAETSSGSLLSTGYIAGGAIAGVLIAFLSFSDNIPRWLAFWQYRTVIVSSSQSALELREAAEWAARRELGYSKDSTAVPEAFQKKQEEGEPLTDAEKKTLDVVTARQKEVEALTDQIVELNADLKPRFVKVPANFKVLLPKKQEYVTTEETTLGQVAKEKADGQAALLFNLNLGTLIEVKAGTVLKLPGKKEADPTAAAALTGLLAAPDGPLLTAATLHPGSLHLGTTDKDYVAPKDMSLDEAAKLTLDRPEPGKEAPERSEKAGELYELNKKTLEPPIVLSEGTALKLPQQTWPALVAFGLLTAFLIVVGMGWLFRPPANGAT